MSLSVCPLDMGTASATKLCHLLWNTKLVEIALTLTNGQPAPHIVGLVSATKKQFVYTLDNCSVEVQFIQFEKLKTRIFLR